MQRLRSAVEEAEARPTLVLAAWQVARVLAVHLSEAVLATRASPPSAWPPCAVCGASLRRKGFATRQMRSLCGPIQWRRRVGRCPQGCASPQVAPFDDAVGGQPHQRSSGELQALGCAWAVFVPFATAARLLGWASGGPVSPQAVWAWGQAAGPRALEPLQSDLATVAQGPMPSPEPLTADLAALPLALGAAGVLGPFRPEAGMPKGKIRWRAIKGGVLARLGPHRPRTGQVVTRLAPRRLVAVLGDIKALTPRLWLAALRQGIRSTPQVGWLSAGGRGVWRLFDACFAASATGVLDFYPAAQPLWKGAAAWWDGRTSQARRWFVWARHRLRHGMPDGGLADLTDAWDVEGFPETARAPLTTVRAYRARHREHIDYAKYKELGLPLGSGMVERACPWRIQQRFKGVGMRWSEDGFNHLLPLRRAWGNGRFDALFVLAQSPHS